MTAAADNLRSRRRHWAAPGGSHDRLVKVLATWLPVGIGVIAAVMVLSPLSPRGEISFLLDRNKVAIVRERLRVENASYTGIDKQDRAFTVSARSAVQKTARDPVVEMHGLVAPVQMKDGPARLSAADGTYDFDKEVVRVGGDVNLSAYDGYRMVTRNVTIDLRAQRISGDGGVAGTIPSGTFTANRIVADLEARTVALEGKARLQMAPGKLRLP